MSQSTSKRSYKDLLITFGPAILLVIAGFWAAYQFVAPPPPKKIVISTGSATGTYYKLAQQYRKALAKEDIELEIISSLGSGENISRLLSKQADLAFVQGGTGKSSDPLFSLGSLYYEPLWVFLRKELEVQKIADLSGLRLGIGQKGSGTQILAKQILELNHIRDDAGQFLSLSFADSARAILNAEIDVAFIVASGNSKTVRQLLQSEQLRLLDMSRADTYVRLLPFLSKVVLPEGIINLEKNYPPQDITLLSPTANLVVAEDFNPALIILLLRAAEKIHGNATVLSDADSFPASDFTAYPINEDAKRFYSVGPPFLMRYLPFWPAVFIDRMIVMLVPLLMLLLPLGKIMPPLYQWRIRSRIYRWYKELQDIDDDIKCLPLSNEQFQLLSHKLEAVESEVTKVRPPLSYADQLYNLLLHIDLVRKKLNALQPVS